MHNTKNSFLKTLKIYLQLKNKLIKFLSVYNFLVFLQTCNTEFDEIIITFDDQNERPLEIEGKVSLTFVY